MNKLTYGDYISPFPTRVPLNEKQYVNLRKPTVNEVMQLGLNEFDVFMAYLKMTPEFYYTELCKNIGGVEYWESLDKEVQDEAKLFDVALADSATRNVLVEVLNFFYEETVVFNNSRFYFINKECDGSKELQPSDIVAIVSDSSSFENALHWCQVYCGIATEEKEEETVRFKNKLAEKMYARLKESKRRMEAAKAKQDAAKYSIPNVISSVCAHHPSINFGNVGQLTIPQLFDSLRRLLAIEGYTVGRTSVSVWGMKDDKEFPVDQWVENIYDK